MAKNGKKPISKIVLGVIVVLVVVCAVGSMGGKSDSSKSDSSSSSTEQAAEKVKQDPYTISDETEDRSNPYGFKITGALTNNTDSKKTYIQVTYVLYDAEGNQVGTALANTNSLKAGGTWKYEAVGTASPDEVASWERDEISGF